nr:MAG TPA: restriction enzyme [Caudoviricetes sp.]
MEITKELLCEKLLEIYKEKGNVYLKDFSKDSGLDINAQWYFNKYGGFKKVCEELGIKLKKYNEIDKKFIDNVVSKMMVDNIPIKKDTLTKYGVNSSTVRRIFGGYNNLLKSYNLKINTPKNVSKDELVEDVLKVVNYFNKVDYGIYKQHGSYSSTTIRKYFGGWNDMIEQLGYEPQNKVYGKEYILKELERCYNLYGFISKYVIDLECDFTYQAISTYFNKEELFELFGNNYRSYGNMSSGMIIITKMLDEKNIKYQLEKTWDWLVNDKTNKHMFVDIYIESLNLVIEFDGNQHFRYSKHFHKNKQKFLNSQYRDKLKEKLLCKHNIKLERISYKDNITNKLLNIIK